MEESLVGFGLVLEGGFAGHSNGLAEAWLTVGVPNDLQMARNLIGGLPVLYQGRLARIDPFRECLIPAHNERQKGGR